jgi:hypothetical protein
MQKILFALIGLGSAFFLSSNAFADETVIHHDDRPPGIVVPLPIPQPDRGDTTVERRQHCESKTVHRENDIGDSETVRKERCD